MKARLKFLLSYFAYWLCIFILAKVIFLLYHFNLTSKFDFTSIIGIFVHGFMLDLSASSYLAIFPLLVLLLTVYTKGKPVAWIINIYTLLALLLIIIATLVDLEIYKYWGIRLDNSALRFVGKPREMLASTSWFMIGILFIALVLIVALLYFMYKRHITKYLINSDKPGWKGLVVFLLLFPLLFVTIRGGTGIAAISISRVYFHPEPYPNHAAINVLWNIGHSLLEKKDQPNPFHYLDDQTARQCLDNLYAEEIPGTELLNRQRPNVILVIIESFTSKLIEPLGGLAGVTPNFNKLCSESILFTNFYANDSRTDKSLVSILSGYPALGKISIIKFPNKTQKLGIVSREIAKAGYHTSFYYGGDVDFANMRSYLVNGMFQEIVEATDFDKSQLTGRWGVHDQYTFQRLLEDGSASGEPFLKVLLTISNHEPFDIPVEPRFGNKTIDERVSSSAFYTDSCLGDFIQKAKQTKWWNNTLIIMLADHGTKFPGNSVVYYPEKYKIPMVWTGGAIRSDTVISAFMSQSDLARTLLNQMDIDASAFPLSRDILRARFNFAFYEFNNGFGMMSDSGNYVFDNDLQKIILNHGTVSDEFLQSGKAIQQEVYEVFLKN